MKSELKELGLQGWELIAVTQDALTYHWIAHLKRAIDGANMSKEISE